MPSVAASVPFFSTIVSTTAPIISIVEKRTVQFF